MFPPTVSRLCCSGSLLFRFRCVSLCFFLYVSAFLSLFSRFFLGICFFFSNLGDVSLGIYSLIFVVLLCVSKNYFVGCTNTPFLCGKCFALFRGGLCFLWLHVSLSVPLSPVSVRQLSSVLVSKLPSFVFLFFSDVFSVCMGLCVFVYLSHVLRSSHVSCSVTIPLSFCTNRHVSLFLVLRSSLMCI